MSVEFKNSLSNTLYEIICGEFIFTLLTCMVLLFASLFIKGEFIQTKGVEAVMTVITMTMLFIIPYVAISYTFIVTLLVTFGLSLIFSFLLLLLGYKGESATG